MNNVGNIGGWELAAIIGILVLMAAGVVAFILTVLHILKSLQARSGGPAPAATVRLATCPSCGIPLPSDAPQGLCPRCVMQVGIATEDTGEPAFKDASGKPSPPDPAELAKHFPQLEILELLGQGGMGAVYKARQKDLDRLVALKVLPGGPGEDPAFAERFMREARALARLSHPNIVAVHDFGQVQRNDHSSAGVPPAPGTGQTEKGTEAAGETPALLYYFIMEFIDGPNLRQLMHGQKLSPREAMTLVPKICEALQFAHDEGIVHRDIKPENILVDKKGRVKIADFGIAKIVGKTRDATITGAKDVIGTPHYMAPEQVEHPTEVDHRADIYSLGVVFYEMLTGELPLGKFEAPSHKVQMDVRLDEVVLRSLAKAPERRYQHASEVKTDVEMIAASEGSAAPAEEPQAPSRTLANRRAWFAPLVVVRQGQRVIHWPGVALDAFLLAGIYAISWLFWVLLLSPFVGTPHVGALFGGMLGFLAAMLGLGFYRSFRTPIDRLKNLDQQSLAQQPHSGGSSAMATATTSAATAPNARFSRLAIIGAGWAGFAMLAVLFQYVAGTEGGPGQSPTALGLALVITLMPLGLTAPIGTTICGVIALSQIRRSEGGLCGLGLALFDLLLFPLLTLDAVVIGLTFLLMGQILVWVGFDSGTEPSLEAVLLPATLIILVIDFWLARRAWRSAKGMLGHVPTATERESAATWMRIAVPVSAALLVGAAALMVATPLQSRRRAEGLRARLQMEVERDAQAMKSTQEEGGSIGSAKGDRFHVTREVTLASPEGRTAELLDLDTGNRATHTAFGENDRETHAWIRSNKLDVLGVVKKGQVALLCNDMAVIPVDNNLWATARPEQVLTNWSLGQQEPKPVVGISPLTDHTDTFFFRTREDGHGMLQILNQSDEPPGVDIRYKLTRTEAATNEVPRFAVRNAPLRDAIQTLAKQAELNVIFDPELESDRGGPNGRSILQTPLNLDWEDVTAEAALNTLLDTHGLMLKPDHRTGVALVSKTSADPLDVSALSPPPVVVSTHPQSGAANVDPALQELRVTFSKSMQDGNWSWVKLDDETFPEMKGDPHYLDDGRTCVLPVKLEPGRTYATWINVDDFELFQDEDGQASVPYLLVFKTKANASATASAAANAPDLVTVGRGGGAQFPSIQEAINAVADGGTVRIGAGQYNERLEITKPVRLIGAGWEQTMIGPTNAWEPPSSEQLQEMQRRFEAAQSDAERARLRAEFTRRIQPPVVFIQNASDVFLEGLKFTQPGVAPDGKLLSGSAIQVWSAELEMKACAVLGSPGSGIALTDGARADIRATLIAAVWNRGVAINDDSRAVIEGCDIRNCHYAGVTISRNAEVVMERCRISGAAWHGIRYDHVSPRIKGNLIFGNARSGIYASGRTAAQVRQNIFFNNEMNGISCWSNNKDVIEGNTFAGNHREALSILGASDPTVRSNIFSGHPVAVYQGRIGGEPESVVPGLPLVLDNLFWNNATNWVRATHMDTNGVWRSEAVELGDVTQSRIADPQFADATQFDFKLSSDSLPCRDGIGAADPIPFASPWPIQPEELAIIPDGDSRDARQWKRPGQ